MSEDQLKAFLEAIKSDPDLQAKLQGASDPEAVVAIAKSAGFVFTGEELARSQAEVSEDQLEAVSGGVHSPTWYVSCNPAPVSVCPDVPTICP